MEMSPLKHGSSDETISQNISEMMHHGHKQDQAVAAALRQSREHAEIKVPDGWRSVVGPKITAKTNLGGDQDKTAHTDYPSPDFGPADR